MAPVWRLIVILSILFGAVSGGVVYYNLQPVEQSNESVLVNIPAGTSSLKIAQILEDNGIIRNSTIFRFYLQVKGVSGQLQAGQYQFTKGETIDRIIQKMINGDVYVETVTFTIPEGLTVEQMAEKLEKEGLVNKEKFLKEVNEGVFSYGFLKGIPQKGVKYRLEGYLFPKTYEMKKGADEHAIIDRMLAQFEREFKQEWRKELEKRKMTMHEIVTLASIIEREVAAEKERAKVAGVLMNRLRQNMLLQADATVQYVLGKQKDRLTYDDLKINDPYNTYLHKGLPPGPIASPGSSSIHAALFPEKHDYLYYVTKKDGSQEHYFARTHEQHLQNKARSMNN